MINKAIEKIKSELDQNKDNPYVQVVGEFLLQHLKENPKAAEKILNKDKTIAKSYEAMEKIAQKKQKNRRAVLAPQEGFEIVLKYFDITAAPIDFTKTNVKTEKAERIAENKTVDFNVSLDDFLK